MKKLVLLLVLVVVLVLVVGFDTTDAAQQQFNWRVQWGREDWPGSFWTHLRATADPTIYGRFAKYLRNSPLASSNEMRITNTRIYGTTGLYKADPSHISTVDGFYLSEAGSNHAFTGSFWNSDYCLPGPTVSVSLSPERRISVDNTTEITLFITINQKRWYEIDSGESWQKAVGKTGPAYIKTGPDMNSSTCADIRWNFTDF